MAELVDLLALARSERWSDRVRAATGLSGYAGRPEVDAVLMTLLLDQYDTAVIDAAAQALVAGDDPAAWRLFVAAWGRADPEQADHLGNAFHTAIWEAVLDPDRAARIRRTLTDLAAPELLAEFDRAVPQ